MRKPTLVALVGLLAGDVPGVLGAPTPEPASGERAGATPDELSGLREAATRHALFEPFLAWETPGVSWLGPDGASTPRPGLGSALLVQLGPGFGPPEGVETAALLATIPEGGRIILAARSGELLLVDGPATVRLTTAGRWIHTLVRRAAAGSGGRPGGEAAAGAGDADRGLAATAADGGQRQTAPADAASPPAPGQVRLLPAPADWREGPWPTLDAGRCPDFRPPWGPPVSPISLEVSAAARSALEAPPGWPLTGDAVASLPSRVLRPEAATYVTWRETAFPPDGRVDLAVAVAASSGVSGASGDRETRGLPGERAASQGPPLGTGAASPGDGPPGPSSPSGPTPTGPAAPDGSRPTGGAGPEANLERWLGLSGGLAPLALALPAGRSLRLSLRPAGQTGPEVALRFETLSSDEAAALTLALRGIEVLRGRLGAGVVGVLSARLLETWGLDADARQLWWGLYRDLSEHPQGPGLLVRAFAAPGDS